MILVAEKLGSAGESSCFPGAAGLSDGASPARPGKLLMRVPQVLLGEDKGAQVCLAIFRQGEGCWP